MKRTISTLSLVFIFLGLAGCAGSSVHVARLELGQGKGKIAVMPVAEAKKTLITSDVERRRRGLLQRAANEASGMFTYTFDNNDYANLRQSVIQSLQQSDAFSEVIDVTDAAPPEDGLRLVLTFSESGIVQTAATSKCILKGSASVARGSAETAPARDIEIEGTSFISVSGAKRKAIKMYLAEIGELLKSLD